MTEALSNPPKDAHISACGLFCTNCRAFKKEKCPGCQIKARFSSCGVRKCCVEKDITTCAECDGCADYNDCKKVNNFIAKVFKFLFKSDRPAALTMIRDRGRAAFIADRQTRGKM